MLQTKTFERIFYWQLHNYYSQVLALSIQSIVYCSSVQDGMWNMSTATTKWTTTNKIYSVFVIFYSLVERISRRETRESPTSLQLPARRYITCTYLIIYTNTPVCTYTYISTSRYIHIYTSVNINSYIHHATLV